MNNIDSQISEKHWSLSTSSLRSINGDNILLEDALSFIFIIIFFSLMFCFLNIFKSDKSNNVEFCLFKEYLGVLCSSVTDAETNNKIISLLIEDM